MSYAIIKSIKIKDGKVFLNHSDNNVYPYTFHEWHCEGLTKILVEQGETALDLEILHEYESGNFQRGANKWERAFKILLHMPEYTAFNWRSNFLGTEDKRREDKTALNALLLKALNSKKPKDKYVIKKRHYQNGGTPDDNYIYMSKLTRRSAFWDRLIGKAKHWNWQADAERVKSIFGEIGKSWEIVKIA